MPDRSVKLSLTNNTGIPLIKIKDHLCDGDFIDIVPPNSIGPSETVTWTSGSKGVLQGTKGYVKYSIGPIGINGSGELAHIFWVNPNSLAPAQAKTAVSSGDISDPSDCDFTKAGNGSAFPTGFCRFQARVTFEAGTPEGREPSEAAFDLISGTLPFFVLGTPSVEHVFYAVTVGPTPNDMTQCAQLLGVDLTKGVRAIIPAVHSIRTWMRLP